MSDLVLITSWIAPSPDAYFLYGYQRVNKTIFTKQQRFDQTKKTIESIKKYIPNSKIIIIDGSLSEDDKKYFIENTDHVLDIRTLQSESKAECEGYQVIEVLKYILDNNLQFDRFFKISGRYWLTEEFNINLYLNTVKPIYGDRNNVLTAFYCLEKKHIMNYYNYLISDYVKNSMRNREGLEVIFARFIKTIDVTTVEKIGIQGNVSVSLDFYNG